MFPLEEFENCEVRLVLETPPNDLSSQRTPGAAFVNSPYARTPYGGSFISSYASQNLHGAHRGIDFLLFLPPILVPGVRAKGYAHSQWASQAVSASLVSETT